MNDHSSAAMDATVDLSARRATPEDAAAVAELFLAAREAAFPAMPRPVHPPEDVGRWVSDQLGPAAPVGRELWVAECAGRLVGYLAVDPEWLDSLYVRPDLTGQGIGSFLMDLARGLRPAGFSLWVFETNTRARAFYHRHGLVEVEWTDGRDNEEKAPDVRMVWPGESPLTFLRGEIDRVDAELARLLARRTALTAGIQRFKPIAGPRGRDAAREEEITRRMAEVAPTLGAERLARILDVVITESLDAARQPAERAGAE
jgi:chorismate mutase/GNAT superfamily N-acetyltransferase